MPEAAGRLPVMVMVHGAWQGAWSFDAWRPSLSARGWTTHALDLPGNGWPPHGDQPASLQAYADTVIDHLSRFAEPVVLVAHSLGCLLAAAWAAHSQNTRRVRGALLVAPGDVEREEIRPLLSSWSPVELGRLPFASVLLGSRNDPYCSLERARLFAHCWGSQFMDYGDCGHINADSGLGSWPEGHVLLQDLMKD